MNTSLFQVEGSLHMSFQQPFDLTGKTAIVTGGGRGLGENIAEALARAGANVVVCSRDLQACQEVSEKLIKMGVRSLALKVDITDPENVQAVVDQTLEKFSRIDILVNNSGATWGATPEEYPLEKWKRVMDVNVTGTFIMSQAVGKVMIEQKYGKIINIASIAGLGGIDPSIINAVGYNTSKGALVTLTKDLGVKWAVHNITVNAIAPGFFKTKMSKGIFEVSGEKVLDQTPMKRFGIVEDIQGVALFLASSASDYIVGQVIAVDGGYSSM